MKRHLVALGAPLVRMAAVWTTLLAAVLFVSGSALASGKVAPVARHKLSDNILNTSTPFRPVTTPTTRCEFIASCR